MSFDPLFAESNTIIIHAFAAMAALILGIKQLGPFSLIHGLSVFVLVTLPMGILHARQHNVTSHRKTMTGIFIGALIIAGIFTLLPGRVMYTVVFGHF